MRFPHELGSHLPATQLNDSQSVGTAHDAPTAHLTGESFPHFGAASDWLASLVPASTGGGGSVGTSLVPHATMPNAVSEAENKSETVGAMRASARVARG